jgi:hypothetical protein
MCLCDYVVKKSGEKKIKVMMKNIYILVCFLLASSMSVAQSHEFTIYGAGGMSDLNYKFDAGKVEGGFGGGAGVAYTYNIDANFGITAGIGFASYAGKVTSETFSGQYNTPDDIGDDFRFSYSVAGYEEKQSATLFTIPLMAQYSAFVDGRKSKLFVAAAGLKFGLPPNATATITPGSVTTTGYYAYEDRTYSDFPQRGFVTGQSATAVKSNIDLGITTMLSLEAGLQFVLNEQTGVYAGLFLDYGLNDIRKTKSSQVVEYQPYSPARFKYNSVLNTEKVNKVNLFSAGIKVGVKLKKAKVKTKDGTQ